MLALGLLLFVGSGVLALGVALDNTDATSVAAFGQTVDSLSLGRVFLAGAVAGAAFLLGLALMLGGLRRRQAQRRTDRGTRREKDRLARENAELRAKVGDPLPVETEDHSPVG